MNHWTDGKITLDMICLDNLCNINIYALIRKLSAKIFLLLYPSVWKLWIAQGRFSKDILSPSSAEAIHRVAIINLGFQPFHTRDRLHEFKSHDWLDRQPWQEDLELWLCLDPFFSYVIFKFSTCIVLPDWLLLPNKRTRHSPVWLGKPQTYPGNSLWQWLFLYLTTHRQKWVQWSTAVLQLKFKNDAQDSWAVVSGEL